MSDIDDKYKLLALLRNLQDEEERNRDLYRTPILSHPDQVMQYFDAYKEYLGWANKLGVVENEFVETHLNRLNSMPTHRDNMGSLMAMVSELTALAEESVKSREKEFNKLLEDNRFLRIQLENYRSKSAAIKSERR